MRHALRGVLLSLLSVADALAQTGAVDRNRDNCLETPLPDEQWVSSSQLHCLKPDPNRTRRDPFGRCQERRFEVKMRNRCEFVILVNWRFNNGMRVQQRALGPNQSFIVDCRQLSDQCDGSVIAYADKFPR